GKDQAKGSVGPIRGFDGSPHPDRFERWNAGRAPQLLSRCRAPGDRACFWQGSRV
ncbi:MAG: hypothetical protein AVDCRST_MAG87-197, partial [uncultured Thermomicrobiales bacterium]